MNAAATASEWNRVVLLFSIPYPTVFFPAQEIAPIDIDPSPSISTRSTEIRLALRPISICKIYIYLFYLLFVLPPPTRSTNLTRIFFASSLERTEGGLTRGRKRMEDKQRMVIDGWERLEGGGGNFSWFEIEVTLRVLHRGYNSA